MHRGYLHRFFGRSFLSALLNCRRSSAPMAENTTEVPPESVLGLYVFKRFVVGGEVSNTDTFSVAVRSRDWLGISWLPRFVFLQFFQFVPQIIAALYLTSILEADHIWLTARARNTAH